MGTLADAFVRVLPDFNFFRPQLEAGLRAESAGAEVRVDVKADTSHLRSDIDRGIGSQLAGISRAFERPFQDAGRDSNSAFLQSFGNNTDKNVLRSIGRDLTAVFPDAFHKSGGESGTHFIGSFGSAARGGAKREAAGFASEFFSDLAYIFPQTITKLITGPSATLFVPLALAAAPLFVTAFVSAVVASTGFLALGGAFAGVLLGSMSALKGVTTAQEALTTAQQNARTAQDGLTSAQRAAQSAESNLASAQRDVRRAQEDLTNARQQAKRTVQDLQDAVSRGSLNEEEARLRLARAQADLNKTNADSKSTALDRQEAALRVRQAEADLGDTLKKNKRNQEDLTDANKKGIDGSDQVRNAQDRLNGALARVSDAAQAVKDSQAKVAEAQDKYNKATNDAQKATDNLAKAQANLNKFPGAQAFMDSIEKLKTTFLNNFASLVQPFIGPFTDSLNKMANALGPIMQSLKPGFEALVPTIGPLTDGFIGFMKAFTPGLVDTLKASAPLLIEFAKDLPGLGAALSDMFKIFAQIGASEAGLRGIDVIFVSLEGSVFVLIGAVTLLSAIFAGALWWIHAMGDFISKGFPEAIRQFMSVWTPTWDAVSGAVSKAWGVITDIWGKIVGFFQRIWDDLWNHSPLREFYNFFAVLIPNALNFAWDTVTRIWGAVAGFFATAWDNIYAHGLAPIWDFITKTLPNAFQGGVTFIEGVWQHFAGALAADWNWVYANVFAPIWDFITKTLPSAFQGGITFIEGVWQHLVNALKGGWDWVYANVFAPVWTFITSTLPGAFTSGITAIEGIWQGLSNRLNDIWVWVRDNVFVKLWDMVLNTIPKAFEGGVNAAKLAWNKIAGFVQAPIKWVIETVIRDAFIKNGVNRIFGVLHLDGLKLPEDWSVPNVPTFSRGGKLPGYSPGRDNMMAMGPSGPLGLAGGEFIVNPLQTRKHLPLLWAINKGVEGFAGGGIFSPGGGQSYQRIFNLAKSKSGVSGLNLSSGYRPGDPGYHGLGLAADITAPSQSGMDGLAEWFRRNVGKYMLELIHSPSWFIKNGNQVGADFYRSVYAAHFNHVHAAMTNAGLDAAGAAAGGGGFGGPIGGGGIFTDWIKAGFGFIGKFADPIEWLLDRVAGPMKALGKNFAGQKFAEIGIGTFDRVKDGVIGIIRDKIAGLVGAGPGGSPGGAPPGGVEHWRSTVLQALQLTGAPASWANGILTIISRESGGNPRAINRTDSNAQRGDPSRGLMQTIGSTFSHYHQAGTSGDIYDPLANIAAAINYIKARYGSISNVQQADPSKPPKGYSLGGLVTADNGAWLDPHSVTTVVNGLSNPERVGNGDLEDLIEELIDAVRGVGSDVGAELTGAGRKLRTSGRTR